MHVLVEVRLDDSTADAELVGDRLWALGAVGVEERLDHVVAAFADPAAADAAAAEFDGRLLPVADTTGLDTWRPHAAVIAAGPFSIRPPWLDPGPGRDLIIDPGHTFGSGSHASTRLAVDLLARHVRPGMHVVDLGAGSGVLSVAAALAGATVTAVDTDSNAEDAIAANAARNRVADRIETRIDDIASIDVEADLALLNVTIDIHERVAPHLRHQRIGPLVVAGILTGDQEARCATAHDRTIVERATHDEWAALVLDHGAPTTPS